MEGVIKGKFRFKAITENGPEIIDDYILEILVPAQFPHDIPVVKEISSKIRRHKSFHINSDGILCLGSPLRLLEIIKYNPNPKKNR